MFYICNDANNIVADGTVEACRPFPGQTVCDTRLLLIQGGVHNGEYVSWLYCYDPSMDVWARKQDMNTKRAIHVLAGMNDRLYAIGGNHLKGKKYGICHEM